MRNQADICSRKLCVRLNLISRILYHIEVTVAPAVLWISARFPSFVLHPLFFFLLFFLFPFFLFFFFFFFCFFYLNGPTIYVFSLASQRFRGTANVVLEFVPKPCNLSDREQRSISNIGRKKSASSFDGITRWLVHRIYTVTLLLTYLSLTSHSILSR